MTKQDLKNGMILEDRIGDKYLLCEGVMRGLSGYTLIYHYSDDLTVKDWSKRDIVKVYKDTEMYNLESMFKEDNLKLLWERKELKLTVLELEVLKALDTLGFVYIARDKDGDLCAYLEEPYRKNDTWYWSGFEGPYYLSKELFLFISSENKEPTLVKDILTRIVK